MRLIYLDEAGNTGSKADPDQPIHMIGSLIVDERHVRSIEVRLNEVAAECAQVLRGSGHFATADAIEFHGAELFGGRGMFKHVAPADRVAICSRIIEVCRDEQAKFGHVAVDKIKLWSGHPHLHCFRFTLERLQDILSRDNELGLIIADEHRELEDELIQGLKFSKEKTTAWGYRPTPIVNIIDTVHFVKSENNRLIQACDVLTYFRLKGQRLRSKLSDSYLKSVERSTGMDYLEYITTRTTKSESAVLKLNSAVMAIEKFEKLWPLY